MRCPPPRQSTESTPHLPARTRGLRSSTHQAGQAREHGVRFLEPDVRSLGAVAGMPAQRHLSAAYAESPSSGEATLAECGESVTVERHGQRNRLEDTVTKPVSACSTFPMRIAVAAFLLAVLLFPAAAPSQTTVVPFGASGYRYTVVEHGGLPTFQSPAYDASSFLLGAAPFGSPGFCPLASTVQTLWPTDSDLLVRRAVTLPAGASDVSVALANDNDVLVYWNGNLIASQAHGGCATHDSPVVSVPDALVQAGSNLLAVRGADRGSQSFLDIRVSAVRKRTARLQQRSRFSEQALAAEPQAALGHPYGHRSRRRPGDRDHHVREAGRGGAGQGRRQDDAGRRVGVGVGSGASPSRAKRQGRRPRLRSRVPGLGRQRQLVHRQGARWRPTRSRPRSGPDQLRSELRLARRLRTLRPRGRFEATGRVVRVEGAAEAGVERALRVTNRCFAPHSDRGPLRRGFRVSGRRDLNSGPLVPQIHPERDGLDGTGRIRSTERNASRA